MKPRPRGPASSLLILLILLAACSCAILPLMMIASYGVNIPYIDDWFVYGPTLIKLHLHQATLADFYVQNAEHRLFLPSLLIGFLTLHGWDTLLIMRAEWLLVCFTSLGILRLLWVTQPNPSEGKRPITAAVATQWLLCNLFIFCPQQWNNWLWGTGLANVMPMTFTVAALVVVTSELRPWSKAILAAMFCASAQYSSGNGILAWGLAGAALAWSESKQEFLEKRRILVFFCCCPVILTAAYFYRFNHNAIDPAEIATGISQAILFGLAFLGNVVNWRMASPTPPAVYFGAILLLIYFLAVLAFVWFWRRGMKPKELRGILIWLMIGMFSVASVAMAAPRRAGYGLAMAVISRYVTFSIYLWISLIVLVQMIFSMMRRGRIIVFVFELLMIAALLAGFPDSFSAANSFAIHLRLGKAGLCLYPALPHNDAAKSICNYPDQGYSMALELNRLGLTHLPFVQSKNADDLQIGKSTVFGAIDRFDISGGNISLSAWDFNPETSRSLDAIFYTFKDDKNRPIIVAVSTQFYPVNESIMQGGIKKDLELNAWTITIPRADLPHDLQATIFTAWAFDAETGQAFPLASTNEVALP